MVCLYYLRFVIVNSKCNWNQNQIIFEDNIHASCWVDDIFHRGSFCEREISEVVYYLDSILLEIKMK